MISTVTGEFMKFDAQLETEDDDFTKAKATFTAEVDSINTKNEQRDGHLKSPDFFDAAKFPNLTFKSTSLKKVSDKKYKLSGDLTMHGVTNKVTLPATINVQGGKFNAVSKFNVALADYKIKVPSLVSKQVSETVEVSVTCGYEPYAR